jgi:hypothetical protein
MDFGMGMGSFVVGTTGDHTRGANKLAALARRVTPQTTKRRGSLPASFAP